MAKIVVLYSSFGGNTRAAAGHVADGARLVPATEVSLMDAAKLDMAALEAADGVAIGSPNYYSYPSGLIKHFFDLALNRASLKGKPLVAFSTHGGGGGVATIIEQLGQSAGMKVVAPGSDSANAPKGDEIKAFRKIGQVLAVAASS